MTSGRGHGLDDVDRPVARDGHVREPAVDRERNAAGSTAARRPAKHPSVRLVEDIDGARSVDVERGRPDRRQVAILFEARVRGPVAPTRGGDARAPGPNLSEDVRPEPHLDRIGEPTRAIRRGRASSRNRHGGVGRAERGVVLDPVAARCEAVGNVRYERPQAIRRPRDERELPEGAASGRAGEDGTGDVAALLGILDARGSRSRGRTRARAARREASGAAGCAWPPARAAAMRPPGARSRCPRAALRRYRRRLRRRVRRARRVARNGCSKDVACALLCWLVGQR